MKIGIYGGSFNPIHFGHIGLARWVVEHTDLDSLWLMVTPNNPLKDSSILADEQIRYQAARQRVEEEGLNNVVVSDFEFQLPRPNYTAQTLRHLADKFPSNEWVLVIGEDNWSVFRKWREWEWIVENISILIYPRHREQSAELWKPACKTKNIIYLSSAPYFDISSTQLRNQAGNR